MKKSLWFLRFIVVLVAAPAEILCQSGSNDSGSGSNCGSGSGSDCSGSSGDPGSVSVSAKVNVVFAVDNSHGTSNDDLLVHFMEEMVDSFDPIGLGGALFSVVRAADMADGFTLLSQGTSEAAVLTQIATVMGSSPGTTSLGVTLNFINDTIFAEDNGVDRECALDVIVILSDGVGTDLSALQAELTGLGIKIITVSFPTTQQDVVDLASSVANAFTIMDNETSSMNANNAANNIASYQVEDCEPDSSDGSDDSDSSSTEKITIPLPLIVLNAGDLYRLPKRYLYGKPIGSSPYFNRYR